MAWVVEFEAGAALDLAAMERPAARRVIEFLRGRIVRAHDPRMLGVALPETPLGVVWRYRTQGFRMVARIDDARFTVLVLRQIASAHAIA